MEGKIPLFIKGKMLQWSPENCVLPKGRGFPLSLFPWIDVERVKEREVD